MAKINITKPTGGSEVLTLVSAFRAEANSYVVFDSEKMGSMGLPIIFISKLVNEKLEKINDSNEWQSLKNYLKGIINGTNFQYIKINDSLRADEAFYTPLTLPQASFDLIKQRYVVKEDNSGQTGEAEVLDVPNNLNAEPQNEGGPSLNEETMTASANVNSLDSMMPKPVENTDIMSNQIGQVPPTMSAPLVKEEPATTLNIPNSVENVNVEQQVTSGLGASVTPVMPNNNAQSNVQVSSEAIENQQVVNSEPATSSNVPTNIENEGVTLNNVLVEESVINSFEADKETFLKACENMFDALVSKYQKQLASLEEREKVLKQKEQEIEVKLKNANEHLANAEAREQVANIAHDNAQRVMDMTNLMPQNPDNNTTGVI